MSYTRDQAYADARRNIARICEEQGLTVRITDPALLAVAASILRSGKERYDRERLA